MEPTTIIALIFLALGSLIATANWYSLYRSYRTHRFVSAIPLIGATFLGLGLLTLARTRPYTWIAFFLDYGTLVVLLASGRIANELWATSRVNLLEEYSGRQGIKTVHLRLFRNSIFTLELCIERPPSQFGLTRTGTIGNWNRDENHLHLRLGNELALFHVENAAR